jgi:hypothetical protein
MDLRATLYLLYSICNNGGLKSDLLYKNQENGDLWKETWHSVQVELLIRMCIDSSPV